MNLFPLEYFASSQFGIVSRSQVLDLYRPKQVQRLVDSRQLEVVSRGVYRLPGCIQSFEQSVVAVTVVDLVGIVVSHRCAARLWRLPGFRDAGVEISVPPGRRIGVGRAITHRTSVALSHAEVLGCIVITTVARTIVDLAVVAPEHKVKRALDHAISNRLTTIEEVLECIEEVSFSNRPGLKKLRKILRRWTEDKSASELERTARRWIREAKLAEPSGQFEVVSDGVPYKLDIAWPDQMLAIEPGGYTYHRSRASFDNDARKIAALVSLGWRIFPMTTETQRHDFVRNVRSGLLNARVP